VSQPGGNAAKRPGFGARQRGDNTENTVGCTTGSPGEAMPEIETLFAATPAAPREARVFLRDALQTWRLDGVGDITEILAGELVANVVRHVGAPGTLRASSHGDTLRVEVDDVNTEVPVVGHPGADDVSGFGMVLVDELANRWGVDRHPGGKTVWFELDLPHGDDGRWT
jgi:hypothetical protein